MAVDQSEGKALLAEIQSAQRIRMNAGKMRGDAFKNGDMKTYYSQNLFIHTLEDQYRSEAERIYQEIREGNALNEKTKKAEEQRIGTMVDKLKAAMPSDSELEDFKKRYMEHATKVFESHGLQMTPERISAANLNAVAEFSKQKQHYQKLVDVTKIFDQMVDFANSDNGKQYKTWDALRKIASDISLQTISNPYKVQSPSGIDAKQIAMKKLITALGDKPITMENMVNHFKELNAKQQTQSRPPHGITMGSVEKKITPSALKDTTKGGGISNTMF